MSSSSSENFLKLVHSHVSFALSPVETSQPMHAVEKYLNKGLLRFNDKLNGVPICYMNLKFQPKKEYGSIFYEQPYVHLSLQCDFLLFKPENGGQIMGKIIKCSENHVALLILGLFNASITGNEMKKKFSFQVADQSWVANDESQQQWQVGESVSFAVVSWQHANGVINISGTVI